MAVFGEKLDLAPEHLQKLADDNLPMAERQDLVSSFGLAGLPFLYTKIIVDGNDAYLPFVHAVLPSWIVLRESAASVTIDANSNLEVVRGYLMECTEDVLGLGIIDAIDFEHVS